MATSILRQKTSLQESIVDMLNEQIKMEAHSSAAYLAMASWCFDQGLVGCGAYFKKQSGEEREHMLKIYDYVLDMGARALSPDITNVNNQFSDLKYVLESALLMEISITNNFNRMAAFAIKVSDFQTLRFFDWFLEEQKEEEGQARRALEIYELIGSGQDGLFKIDHEIRKLGAIQ